MRYLFDKIRDMQMKTKLITIFTILSIVTLTITIIILTRSTQAKVINLTLVSTSSIPNSNSTIKHYNGAIRTKDEQGNDKDINFSA